MKITIKEYLKTIQKYLQNVKSKGVIAALVTMSLIGTSGLIALADENPNETENVEEIESVTAADKDEKSDNENEESNDDGEEDDKDEGENEEDEEDQDSPEDLILPAEGDLSSEYGYRIHPIHKTEKLHAGIDIAGDGPIVAAQSGKVVEVGYSPQGWGNYIKIDHGDNIETLYAHLEDDSITVSEDDEVSKEEKVGKMGTTGGSTGVHLHFEVYEDGEQVDPEPYLPL